MTAVDHVALWLWKGSSVAAAGPAFACRFIPQFTIQALHRHSSNCATTTRSVAASDELHATSETTVGKPGSERSSMAEDEPSGTEAAPTSPAARTLKIPCLVTGVGYTFTVQVNDDFTVTRFREMAWRHLVQTINENPRLPVMTGENEDTTIQVEEYADVETRGCIRVCLGSVTPSNASHCWCPEERVQRVSSGLARFRACCCGQKRPCFSLYLAKGPTKGWLTEDSIFIKTLQCGRVPWTIKWLVLTTSNMIRLAENQTLADLDLPDYGGPGEICILVHNAPMDITAGLRVTVENDIRYYKMVHAQGRARLFAWWSLICVIASVVCGVSYVFDKEQSTKSGDNPFWTPQRVTLFVFPALAGLLLKVRDNYQLVSETLEKRIDYSKVAGISSSSASAKAPESVEAGGEP